ncbi:hypothetical protein CLV51_101833 [Chitinophaga niastensis]|uniref:Uncharacterized protein n=1 Tax=Chitinophaga niastensis TaxID=536980 RepID=A0A2P8HTE9_CHINA|nr:hypothetical protein [Chitinophaga niastensis]PSL49499.1 hypothetical protein CLV51_101833 [Chitinophaga niastensis]
MFKNQLDLLRQQIPIGIHHAINLLDKTNGDIAQAKSLFEEEIVNIIINKTSVLPEVAKRHLIKNGYDISKTLISIDEERFTLTELILHKTKNNKEDGLYKIAYAIEERENLKRNFWLSFESLGNLNAYQYCIVTICEWLEYEDYENFSSALYFYVDIVTNEIEIKLSLPQVANYIRRAKQRREEILALYKEKQQDKNFILVGEFVERDKEYRKNEDAFHKERTLIIDRLHDLVMKNVSRFP